MLSPRREPETRKKRSQNVKTDAAKISALTFHGGADEVGGLHALGHERVLEVDTRHVGRQDGLEAQGEGASDEEDFGSHVPFFTSTFLALQHLSTFFSLVNLLISRGDETANAYFSPFTKFTYDDDPQYSSDSGNKRSQLSQNTRGGCC